MNGGFFMSRMIYLALTWKQARYLDQLTFDYEQAIQLLDGDYVDLSVIHDFCCMIRAKLAEEMRI